MVHKLYWPAQNNGSKKVITEFLKKKKKLCINDKDASFESKSMIEI